MKIITITGAEERNSEYQKPVPVPLKREPTNIKPSRKHGRQHKNIKHKFLKQIGNRQGMNTVQNILLQERLRYRNTAT